MLSELCCHSEVSRSLRTENRLRGGKCRTGKCMGGKCRTGKCGTSFTSWIEL